ncbi:sporulation protein [Siminovitchia acidinfaciens]|uniref:Sporulation protein n=1 Tax=Siminovitchia acidinfaciens TaxID=2321395 RepID=A0A429Y493_9BACI|nr:GerMN domain-containing protein [Siminovitchia acidinfaciens]RST76256.1 sporulation protein [Siminovitchia acidinfaciens]
MCKRAKIAAVAVILAASAFISGCGLFGKGKEKLDPPQDVTYLKEGEGLETAPEETASDKETAGEEKAGTVMRDLYLIDRNGMVVSQTLPLPASESAAKQALEYLVADGPVAEILPNGFRTVLPADTTVDVDIQDGKAIVDFSEEFASYDAKDEKKILQAVTWTLTQFESVKTVELRMNGHRLNEMPVNGTPISEEGLSRQDGINIDDSEAVDITNTRPMTVYYLSQADDEIYYVPVTRRISNNEQDDVAAVIKELADGPGMLMGLASALTSDVKLIDEPKIEEGVVTLNFNESIMGSEEKKIITDVALQSLVLSLTEQEGIESVSVLVDGKAELANEKGEPLTEPVMRPEKVNAESN